MAQGIILSPDAVVTSLVTIVLTLATTYMAAYRHGLQAGKAQGRSQTLQELNRDSAKKRYQELYVPLARLFADHIFATCTAIRYSSLRIRIARSWRFAKRGQIRYSINALVDLGISETATFECGREFPFDEIQRLVQDNLDIADRELQNLVGSLQRMRFYEHQPNRESAPNPWDHETVLGLEEQALYSHIIKEYEILNEMFIHQA
jgi:hypothetical protein